MGSAFVGIIFTLGTLYLCCAVALVWSTRSYSTALARILRYSGIFWAIWLTLCFATLGLLTKRCTGNWIYGYTNCDGISDGTAQVLTGVSTLSFAAGICCGVILLVAGGIWEIVGRSRAQA
ncbi:hypothetical protein [Jannaschia sp. CCS1]|uniref:hypothetical protein n=1 Tax=Jannaschia sp. (strain CCS1) TaxID=290400 RepID=UPI000053BA7A|nr:hypothetical protein [Jannaschia sp. CCS1]ABD55710.1 hypothetical protein Jann_2793 [Jannaschia sp. CCS1]